MGSINPIDQPPLVPAEIREALAHYRSEGLTGIIEVHVKQGRVNVVDYRIERVIVPEPAVGRIFKRG